MQEYLLRVYNWLLIALPEAYNYIVNLLFILKRTIYELSPEFFDSLALKLNDAIKYVMRTLPVVIEQARVYVNACVTATRNYVSQGQMWMQQQMQR